MKRKNKRKQHSSDIAVCSIEVGQASNEVQLTPAGRFRSVDGRPRDTQFWFIDAAIAARLIEAASLRATPYILDYEHQTLMADRNGQPAPRAATFSKLEWREGEGLFAIDVEWTARAKQYIKDGEYGFVSPVFSYHKSSGEVLQFLHAALTNTPALDGMNEVAALAMKHNLSQEDNIMDREILIAMLNLSADASDEDIKSAIAALKQADEASQTLGEEVTALKQTQFDPSKHVELGTFEEVKSELATLKAASLDAEVASLVALGMKDGRLLPAQEAWASDLGKKDVAALKSYLDTTPAIEALKRTQTDGTPPEGGDDVQLSAEEVAVCTQMNVSPEDYKKNKGTGE